MRRVISTQTENFTNLNLGFLIQQLNNRHYISALLLNIMTCITIRKEEAENLPKSAKQAPLLLAWILSMFGHHSFERSPPWLSPTHGQASISLKATDLFSRFDSRSVPPT